MSENWDFYPCRVEEQPASIMVNLGLAAEAPLASLPECAWLHVLLKHPRPDGLSGPDEFDRLSEIGDVLDAAVGEASVPIRYVGRCTAGGRRDYYTYAGSGLAAESLLSSVMSGFPEYQFATGFRSDPQWRVYREFLYPTGRSLQLINNRRLLDALEQRGDAANVPRPIRHFATFDESESCNSFCSAVREAGFDLVARSILEESGRHTVVLERTDTVDFESINSLTLDLFDLTNSCGGEYDGWETQVQLPPADAGLQE